MTTEAEVPATPGPASPRAARVAQLLRPRRLTPRSWSLGTGALLVVLLAVVAALLPVPYVVLTPGPTANTLGADGKNGDVIRITGRQTYPTSGHLQLLTVSVYGGPGSPVDLFTAVRAWFNSADAVVPRESVFPKGQTQQQAKRENAEEMQLSQSSAVTAALGELHIPVSHRLVVQAVETDAPAKGVLKAGDGIVSVDGSPVSDPQAVRDLIQRHQPGQRVAMVVQRNGQRVALDVPTGTGPQGKAFLGITPAVDAVYPFKVDIRLQDVGGPSAGMMFALGIIDKLTPGSATGGAFVAGTGTISDNGSVGPIGGIQQKLVAARRAGATWFLAPAGNCADTQGDVPRGLRVVEVSTLHAAVQALAAISSGTGASLPRC